MLLETSSKYLMFFECSCSIDFDLYGLRLFAFRCCFFLHLEKRVFNGIILEKYAILF